MSKVVYEGWMVRFGRRKIGRSFIHMRYFVLETRMLAYYKRKPQDIMLPIKTLLIDGNCRVEDRGLKMHHGHMVYVLCVYNKKEKYHQIMMAAFNIQEALIWKEKIELVIDQQDFITANGNKVYASIPYGPMADDGRNASSSDRESQCSPEEEEEESRPTLSRRITIGNGFPDSVPDWTCDVDSGLLSENNSDKVFSRKHWRLVRCQNGLRIFEELVEVDYLPRSCSKAMKAVGIMEATCESIFQLVMRMDGMRFEWDCSFQYGSLVEEVDGHTAILYHRLQLDWFPVFVWPRDLCYVRYWRRNDDGSYGENVLAVVLFRSREHVNCSPQPGFVRAHVERLREWFSQTDENYDVSKMPLMVNMTAETAPIKKDRKRKTQENSVQPNSSQYQMHGASRHHVMLDEDSDDDEDYKIPEPEQEVYPIKLENEINKAVLGEEPSASIDLSGFSGNLRRDDLDKSRNCWRISDGNNFRVRSKQFIYDKTKIPAGKHLMELVAVDWFKDVKRIDHVARRKGCAVQVASEKGLFSLVINVQVPASTHYSMVFYFVSKPLVPGSLLQLFVDGDDEYRNSRFKLIPAVPKGSWIVRQSVGSTPCLLGKAVDCTYIRGPDYLEIDVDIGSSTVANGVLGLVFGVITTLVVDMAFLVQANTYEELPERLIGAVRVSHVELSSALVPVLEASDPNV
ncbi:protein ENHANCED DISEASE RESISTANCE 2-like isoform X6 [Musa acuminata AAA Group]|uniref:protein ENHANCED DISEASE RESISTANCE 2-like isoform X6 n=1 Tax=Musa acuminata AAA Group TaxID=214697 RepID=UPI0031CEEE29